MSLIVKGQYVWDFWYVYTQSTRMFDVYFLHADSQYVSDDQHHFHASVGRCKTMDWVDFFAIQLRVVRAQTNLWADTSIWTGDSVAYKGGRAIFYTSRNQNDSDPMRQGIGVAYESKDGSIRVSDCRIDTPAGYYLEKTDPLEDSIHCWRDPYVFEMDGHMYMLVAAKRKDYPLNHRGCIALMRLESKSNLEQWKHVCTLVATDYAEVELPQIYRTSNGKVRVFFNAHSHDGQSHYVMTRPFIFDEENFKVDIDIDICRDIPEYLHYYGYRIIPEYNSIICAFSKKYGRVEIIQNVPSLGIGHIFSLKPST